MDKKQIYKLLATIHDEIEDSILSNIKPGVSYIDLCTLIEKSIDTKTKDLEFESKGIAFPVGINVNHCAAHDSPFFKDERIFKEDDVIKIDYGIQINGYILDAAFTVCFKEHYRDLLETTRKACMEAARLFYPGTKISSISKKICQVVGDKYTLLNNLCGHQIQPYKIHSGKVVPNTLIKYDEKVLENEVFTVEPYLSTSKNHGGETYEQGEVSHYMFHYYNKSFENIAFLKMIPTLYNCKTLAFHKRWLSEKDVSYLESLVNKGLYKTYPPIYDKDPTAKVAQFETTILVTDDEPFICKQYDKVDKYILKHSS